MNKTLVFQEIFHREILTAFPRGCNEIASGDEKV